MLGLHARQRRQVEGVAVTVDAQFIVGLVVGIPLGWWLVGRIQRFFRT